MESRQVELLEKLERLVSEGRKLHTPGECNYAESFDWLTRVHEALTAYPEAQGRFRLFCLESFLVVPDKVYWALKILTDVEGLEKRGCSERGVYGELVL